jgi:hypothetical protein
MSKQQQDREKQNYTPKVVPRTCPNCRSYQCVVTSHKHAFGDYEQVSNQRCGLGGFAVKRTSGCDLWVSKEVGT